MDPVGLRPQIVTAPAPALPVPTRGSAVELPKPDAAAAQVNIDVQAAEQQRYEAIQRMAQDFANVFIVSDRRFTIFKDVTGQYITRFTSLRDGHVTYIPEPELF